MNDHDHDGASESDLADFELSPFASSHLAPVSAEAPRAPNAAASGDVSDVAAWRTAEIWSNGLETAPIGLENEIAAHPFGGQCKICSAKLESPMFRTIHAVLAPGWHPVNCCDVCYASAKSTGDNESGMIESWMQRCPIEFRDDWDARKLPDDLLRRVMRFDPRLHKGMIIHGPSGTGKTRAVWRLLRRLSTESIAWVFAESLEILESGFDVGGAEFARVLVLDDLGNDDLRGPREVRLLKLLRTRANWHRPTIVTTQFDSAGLMKRFSETATAQAVIRRLRESCESVYAKNLTV